MRRLVTLLALATLTSGCGDPSPVAPEARSLASAAASCTRVIGFSQTREWYIFGGFEGFVDDGEWELLWESGGEVDRWADPDYEGWENAPLSACTTGAPNRVLFTVSGRHGRNVDAWESAIRNVIPTIRQKVPTVRRILLQPVVGLTDEPERTCRVRAARQHPYILDAIKRVAGSERGVGLGADPHVRDCSDYSDSPGHLTADAEPVVAERVAGFFLMPPP